MKKRKANILLWITIGVIAFMFSLYYFSAKKEETAKIFFLKDEKPASVKRIFSKGADEMHFAAIELIKGPSEEEKKQGYVSLIPRNTRILKIIKKGDIVIVDFSTEISDYGGGAQNIQGMIEQIVYTFTSLPGIKKVKILIEGEDEPVLGGEGFIIEKALSREDLRLEKF
jgi:germination protein M